MKNAERYITEARALVATGNQIAQLAMIGLLVWFFSSLGLVDLSPGKDSTASEFVSDLAKKADKTTQKCQEFKRAYLSQTAPETLDPDLKISREIEQLFLPPLNASRPKWPTQIDDIDWDQADKHLKFEYNACDKSRKDLISLINDKMAESSFELLGLKLSSVNVLFSPLLGAIGILVL